VTRNQDTFFERIKKTHVICMTTTAKVFKWKRIPQMENELSILSAKLACAINP
jgi:hypothetical protein